MAILRVFFIIGIAAWVGGCASEPNPLAPQFEKMVGNRYWFAPDKVLLCMGPGSGCTLMKGGSLVVTEYYAPFYLKVETAEGASGYIYGEDAPLLTSREPTATPVKPQQPQKARRPAKLPREPQQSLANPDHV